MIQTVLEAWQIAQKLQQLLQAHNEAALCVSSLCQTAKNVHAKNHKTFLWKFLWSVSFIRVGNLSQKKRMNSQGFFGRDAFVNLSESRTRNIRHTKSLTFFSTSHRYAFIILPFISFDLWLLCPISLGISFEMFLNDFYFLVHFSADFTCFISWCPEWETWEQMPESHSNVLKPRDRITRR